MSKITYRLYSLKDISPNSISTSVTLKNGEIYQVKPRNGETFASLDMWVDTVCAKNKISYVEGVLLEEENASGMRSKKKLVYSNPPPSDSSSKIEPQPQPQPQPQQPSLNTMSPTHYPLVDAVYDSDDSTLISSIVNSKNAYPVRATLYYGKSYDEAIKFYKSILNSMVRLSIPMGVIDLLEAMRVTDAKTMKGFRDTYAYENLCANKEKYDTFRDKLFGLSDALSIGAATYAIEREYIHAVPKSSGYENYLKIYNTLKDTVSKYPTLLHEKTCFTTEANSNLYVKRGDDLHMVHFTPDCKVIQIDGETMGHKWASFKEAGIERPVFYVALNSFHTLKMITDV